MSTQSAKAGAIAGAYRRVENAFDAPFGASCNPLRHLGALGFLFFWVVAVSGIYLYAVLDTSVTDIHASIDRYSREQWYLAGLMRSLHRYASDALVLVMGLHLLREFLLGRYAGFRWFSWITGVPLIWLVYASGIGGFWIVWDRLAQFSAIATGEWLDWLPIFSDPMTRNFLTPGAITDRFFSLLVFMHIGVPLLLLLGLWFHIQRIAQADVFPRRGLAWGAMLALVALSLARPVMSDLPADLAVVAQPAEFDWFLLFPHPLMYASSPAALWAITLGATAALLALPLLGRVPARPVAVVDPAFCSGCRRCLRDCPFGAISMVPHPSGKPGLQLARVSAELCASCGICAGSCPSSTPFRSTEDLVTGIDMPQLPVAALRERLDDGLRSRRGNDFVALFGCDRGVAVGAFAGAETLALSAMCVAMIPPSFVEYALRAGASGVMISGCRDGGCEFRLGNRWTEERLSGAREPHLRPTVPRERVWVCWADAAEPGRLRGELQRFRQHLRGLPAEAGQRVSARRMASHG